MPGISRIPELVRFRYHLTQRTATGGTMSRLAKTDLLGRVLDSIKESGWLPVVIERRHPFLIRARESDSGMVLNLRVYIWNCTHGGGSRAWNEYRIQSTSGQLEQRKGERTLLLGWRDELGVFAAWDVEAHIQQNSVSPSAQVKEQTLLAAQEGAFSTQEKENEVVVAFAPFLFMEYVSCKDLFHQTGWAHRDIALMDHLDDLSDEDIQSVRNGPRRLLIKTIRQKYRAKDFSRRVLDAYLHRCAFCGVQLKLLDAAHIVPVAAPDSTDEVNNGVALCKLHHFAYDSNLVAFDTEYRIRISNRRVHDLQEAGLDGGLENFVRSLQPTLVLPEFRRHYPDRDCIERALEYRGWEI
ncbi:hypothetical protein CFB46_04110 [Burkholderia sp. HI2761]|uniref:HNH endonuclease n=1 Tax=unclassified Burkholderia TaxID=2613784 RepID=UPI000B7A4966|nr:MULTISPECIES: HNH endonuclease [unclassified Burkholderia]MPV59976.1 hypothetical protein [Burkholderia sp. BE24]OXJ30215.1 hypothetical protein CFB46_04110 [Burkholderia sp. HI2761]